MYTYELLAEAAGRAQDIDDVIRWCGGRPTPASRHYVRAKMAGASLPVPPAVSGGVRHTEERLRAAVRAAGSIKDVVRLLGISQVGGNQAHISRRIAALGIDTSHFGPGVRGTSRRTPQALLSLRDPGRGRVPGRRLRAALLSQGVADRCVLCGTGPQWCGRPLALEVDHVNGDWWDNRPANLRLLCPNCHAATDTYRGRKKAPR